MSTSTMPEHVAALGSPDISTRIEAIVGLTQQPDAARPALATLIADPDAPVIARVWAMIAICQIKDDARQLASRAIVSSLSAIEAIVRRSALETLGTLKVDWAVQQIADSLNDDEPIPEAWFDDGASPSQAARRALEAIGTPEALRILGTSSGK